MKEIKYPLSCKSVRILIKMSKIAETTKPYTGPLKSMQCSAELLEMARIAAANKCMNVQHACKWFVWESRADCNYYVNNVHGIPLHELYCFELKMQPQ